MNKKHWITINLTSGIPSSVILDCINQSYELVYNSLSKKQRAQLEETRK
jgi:predicted DNA-binding protein (MmcQ/YjbR family)